MALHTRTHKKERKENRRKNELARRSYKSMLQVQNYNLSIKVDEKKEVNPSGLYYLLVLFSTVVFIFK